MYFSKIKINLKYLILFTADKFYATFLFILFLILMATYSETAFASQLPFLFILQKKKSKVIIGSKMTDLTDK